MASFDSIDIMKLYAGTLPGFEDDFQRLKDDGNRAIFNEHRSAKLLRSHDKWNLWLNKCERDQNINELLRVLRSLQVGMAEAQKKHLVNEDVAIVFARWVGSISKTARRIINKKYPLPPKTDENFKKYQQMKRKRDSELEKFTLKMSY